MELTYAQAKAVVHGAEVGRADVAGDPGGLTVDGVASHANPAAFADGVVTPDEVEASYRERWDAIRGDELAALCPRTTLALFDWYYHSGGPAVRALQRIVYPMIEQTTATVDGNLGPGTMGRVRAWLQRPGVLEHDRELAGRLLHARAEFLEGWLKGDPVLRQLSPTDREALRIKFLGGFVRRLVGLAFRVA